jgi:mannose-6-phosphate isomerase-like protein (cupin superfamily)
MRTQINPTASCGCFDFGSFGVQRKIDASLTSGRFSLVHHSLAPHTLAAPLHYHHREDVYSYVLQGRMGFMLGDEAAIIGSGNWIFKPRREWHTFWNSGDTPCEVIELISPGGFEEYFHEVAGAWDDIERFAKINLKYEIEMDFRSVRTLCNRFGLILRKL